jgi:hypothetical protein
MPPRLGRPMDEKLPRLPAGMPSKVGCCMEDRLSPAKASGPAGVQQDTQQGSSVRQMV